MATRKKFTLRYLLSVLLLLAIIPAAQAAEEYVTLQDLAKAKKFQDDPRPFLQELSFKKIMPPEAYSKLTFDVDAMKNLWAELVGFRSPEIVGKIAPEIKPGTYTYQDKEKYPGLKQLMIPDYYARFKPSAPPHACNFPEIKVVPTRQYYYALPTAEATQKNRGRTKLDDLGYLIPESYISGFPFPRPDGKFKAQQIIYNWEKRYFLPESAVMLTENAGYTKNLTMDFEGSAKFYRLRLQGRTVMTPSGWFDERARQQAENRGLFMQYLSPRDYYGNILTITSYLDLNHYDQFLMYINSMRRVRKMSATDTQDAVGGQDIIYEDMELFDQKLSPKRYPYKFEVVEEREFLVHAPTLDGSMYLTKNLELRNAEFERRPVYVVKLTQLDRNYIYSQRILYIDQETFFLFHIQNYDQKGRLYRAGETYSFFVPEMGLHATLANINRDYIDYHTNFNKQFTMPAPWLERKHFNMESLFKKGK